MSNNIYELFINIEFKGDISGNLNCYQYESTTASKCKNNSSNLKSDNISKIYFPIDYKINSNTGNGMYFFSDDYIKKKIILKKDISKFEEIIKFNIEFILKILFKINKIIIIDKKCFQIQDIGLYNLNKKNFYSCENKKTEVTDTTLKKDAIKNLEEKLKKSQKMALEYDDRYKKLDSEAQKIMLDNNVNKNKMDIINDDSKLDELIKNHANQQIKNISTNCKQFKYLKSTGIVRICKLDAFDVTINLKVINISPKNLNKFNIDNIDNINNNIISSYSNNCQQQLKKIQSIINEIKKENSENNENKKQLNKFKIENNKLKQII